MRYRILREGHLGKMRYRILHEGHLGKMGYRILREGHPVKTGYYKLPKRQSLRIKEEEILEFSDFLFLFFSCFFNTANQNGIATSPFQENLHFFPYALSHQRLS